VTLRLVYLIFCQLSAWVRVLVRLVPGSTNRGVPLVSLLHGELADDLFVGVLGGGETDLGVDLQ
jgi:hypothetical protein